MAAVAHRLRRGDGGVACARGRRCCAQDLAAKAALCDACHGEQGIPADPMMPVIWGQHQPYLIRQIGEFKLGNRPNEPMLRLSATCRDLEMAALADYFAQKPWPSSTSLAPRRPRRSARRRPSSPASAWPATASWAWATAPSAHRRPEPRLHAENLAGVPEQGARQQSLDVGHPRPAHADDLVAWPRSWPAADCERAVISDWRPSEATSGSGRWIMRRKISRPRLRQTARGRGGAHGAATGVEGPGRRSRCATTSRISARSSISTMPCCRRRPTTSDTSYKAAARPAQARLHAGYRQAAAIMPTARG